jgi:acetylornithine deacetylase/succinyl-diaminopimelate desuccinylase-like protein
VAHCPVTTRPIDDDTDMTVHPVQLLRELIAIPSVNPSLAVEGDPSAGEARMATHLELLGRKHGLEVESLEVLPGRPNVLLRLLPSGRVNRRILLAPHLDTVRATSDQLKPRTKGDRIHGRGACDTKGCVAAMVAAVLNLARERSRPANTEIIFAGLVDEEYKQLGSRHLAASGLKADLAIVGEPTRLKVVTAHKGDLWLRLFTRGKAAHGATPHLGRNAVHMAAKVVELLEGPYAKSLRQRSHPLLGQPTINVGAIAGGCQPNIVPDVCEIQADRRTLPGESPASVMRELRALFREAGLMVRMEDQKGLDCLPLETDPAIPLVGELMRAAGVRKPVGVHYFCDASVLSAGGIPSVVFGPGDIAQAHTVDEWISIRSLESATAILRQFLGEQP